MCVHYSREAPFEQICNLLTSQLIHKKTELEVPGQCLCLWEIDFPPHKRGNLWSNWYLGIEKVIHEEIAALNFHHHQTLTSESTF